MTHAALPTAVALDDLPLDALALVAEDLLEMELFRLSHVSSELLHTLSSDAVWRDKESKQQQQYEHQAKRWFAPMRDTERRVSAKEDVMRHHALLFIGDRMDDTDVVGQVPNEHHAFAFGNTVFQRPSVVKKQERHQRSQRERERRPVAKNLTSAFSFELWFSVDTVAKTKDPAMTTQQMRQGGVLFGAQSKPFTTPATSFFYQQFAMVDPTLRLYCSLRKSEDKAPLAVLAVDRWYHLVLVNDTEREIVYLDGHIVSVVTGLLSAFFWSQYAHCQVGTGLVRNRWHASEPGADAAMRSRISWYNFHGVVDTFRAYDHALPKSSVQELALANAAPVGSSFEDTAPVFSMRQELLVLRGDASTKHCYVRCTRPQDGKFERL